MKVCVCRAPELCILFLVSVSDNPPYAIFIDFYYSAFTLAVSH